MFGRIRLSLKVLTSFGVFGGMQFFVAHLLKLKMVYVFIEELHSSILMRPWTGDFATVRQVVWDKEYDHSFGNIKTIVDLGANIGISTLVLAKKFPRAKIVALEPERVNFSLLSINTMKLKNVILLNEAIWYKDGNVQLSDDRVKSNEFQYIDMTENGEIQLTSAITITSLMQKFGLEKIDLLKIDVEGAEEFIFTHNLNWLPYVQNCIIEIHSQTFKNKLLEIMQKDFSYTTSGEKLLFVRKDKAQTFKAVQSYQP